MNDRPKTTLENRLKSVEIERDTFKGWCQRLERTVLNLTEKCMNLEIENEQLKEEIVELSRQLGSID